MKIITLSAGLRDHGGYPVRFGMLVFSSSLLILPASAAFSAELSDRPFAPDSASPVVFNSAFIHGSAVDVKRFAAGNPVPPGQAAVKVRVNGKIRGKYDVLFVAVPGRDIAEPCFSAAQLEQFGIRPPVMKYRGTDFTPDGEQCNALPQWIDGASTRYDPADFELDLFVPQLYLVSQLPGYTNPASWDSGVPAMFLDYTANVYTQQFSRAYSNGVGHAISANLGLLTGINLFGWQLRNRSSSYFSGSEAPGSRNLYTYARHDIPRMKSQVTLGETVTSGDLFDSLNIRGVQLASDDRMLPESLRQYNPVIQGIAESNARVQVTQHGQLIYETTVPPGPFELNSIGAMGYGGDLQMTIIEADGQQRSQVIPYSAPPMLLHAGISRYSVSVGEMNESSMKKNPLMATGFYQYGMNNFYTLYGGGQFSENYLSLAIGQSFNTRVGGISVDITRARSRLKDSRISTGNSFNVGFSKYLEYSATNISMVAYRYSSKGFYSLRDAAAERYGMGRDYYLIDYRTRQRLSVNLAQTLPGDSRLVLAGNFYQYWNNRNASSQYSLYFSKSQRLFSWSAGISRSYNAIGKNINSYSLSLTIPLSRRYNITDKPLFTSMSMMMSRDNNGNTSLITNANGSRGERSALSYGLGTSTSRTRGGGTSYSLNGNMNHYSDMGQFGSTLAIGNQSRQFSATANGSLVAHRGGLTMGPPLGESPFAIVNVPGATGARLLNGYGARVDSRGYAIVPSLTPYRENTVSVDSKGLPDTVDILQNEQVIIPRSGAAVAVKMKTQSGKPVLLIIRDPGGNYLPIGSELTNASGEMAGIVGQAGMAFIRGWSIGTEAMSVRTGSTTCTIPADKALAQDIALSGSSAVIRAEVICKS